MLGDKMKVSKLANKDVVDVVTANKLGRIKDIDVDIKTGKIISFDVVLNMKISNLLKNNNKIKVMWENVENIGDEVILINKK